MPQTQALRELIKLEAKLSAPPPPKTVTKAPDPIRTVGSQESATKNLAQLAEPDDVSAYIKRRHKQMAGKPKE